jgi:DNA-binding transcriptional ArsR family regulator
MSGASLNHHLNILRNANLVVSEKQGQFILYSLNTTILQEIIEWVYELRHDKSETSIAMESIPADNKKVNLISRNLIRDRKELKRSKK